MTGRTKPMADATPITRAELDALIVEWHAAERDVTAHYVRYSEYRSAPLSACSDEARADWHRANDRQAAASKALADYARSMKPDPVAVGETLMAMAVAEEEALRLTRADYDKLCALAKSRKTTPEACLREFVRTCQPDGGDWKHPAKASR